MPIHGRRHVYDEDVAPTPGLCLEKKRLMDAYLAAMEEILALHNRESMEIANQGVGLAGFDADLKAARAKNDAARAAWIEHLAQHGC